MVFFKPQQFELDIIRTAFEDETSLLLHELPFQSRIDDTVKRIDLQPKKHTTSVRFLMMPKSSLWKDGHGSAISRHLSFSNLSVLSKYKQHGLAGATIRSQENVASWRRCGKITVAHYDKMRLLLTCVWIKVKKTNTVRESCVCLCLFFFCFKCNLEFLLKSKGHHGITADSDGPGALVLYSDRHWSHSLCRT